MTGEKIVDAGGGRQAVLKPTLAERPALGPVVAAVVIKAPWWPGPARRRVVVLLDAVAGAFRLRARDEKDLDVLGERNKVVVRRRLPNGETELRFERRSRGWATFYCDRRELENLYALGILKQARVVWPDKNERGIKRPTS